MKTNPLIFNSNKAMVSYLLKMGCKVQEVKLGKNDTILFGFNREETQKYVDKWMNNKTGSLVICNTHQGINIDTI